MLKFHAMAMGGPSEAPGMRALKTNACAGTEKPPAGLSEAPLGVSQRLSGAELLLGRAMPRRMAHATHDP